MTVLNHKGFQGAVSYEDGALIIEILHIEDIISTQCDSASEVRRAFEELVDDYIETCKALGRDPNKPFKGSFNVRMTPELHKRISMAAAACEDSLNAWVVKACEERISDQGIKKAEFVNILSQAIYLGRSAHAWTTTREKVSERSSHHEGPFSSKIYDRFAAERLSNFALKGERFQVSRNS